MDYVPQNTKEAGPLEREIVIANPANPVELYDFLDLFVELNSRKVISEAQFIYRIDERIRHHDLVGDYTVTIISELTDNQGIIPLYAVTCIDKETGLPLTNILNKEIRKVNHMLRTKGLDALVKKRGLQLAAARSHSYRPKFTGKAGPDKTDATRLARKLREAKA